MDKESKEETKTDSGTGKVSKAQRAKAELESIKPKKLSKREKNAMVAKGEFDPLSVIKEICYREIAPSMNKIISIRDNPKSSTKEQMEASKYIVDVSINLVELDRSQIKPDDSVNKNIVAVLAELSKPATDKAQQAKEVRSVHKEPEIIDVDDGSEDDDT